ncbi:MAG TPA: mechanosensitive ion channel family protein [Dehalococcoidia bacterium]
MALTDLVPDPSLTPVLDAVQEAQDTGERFLTWLDQSAPGLITIVVLALAANYAVRRLAPEAVKRGLRRPRASETEAEFEKRVETLVSVFQHTASVAIVGVAILTALPKLGLNITPLLTGLGITGLALGLGAQTLVRDVINGIFILLEDQYGKGDVISVGAVTGRVEEVNLRRTVVRDINTGTVYSIPNSAISITGNLTRGWSGIDLNVTVAYEEDIERAREVIDRVGSDLAADPAWGPRITSPPRVARVEGLEDAGVVLRVQGGARPGEQWAVTGELRARIKRAFEEAGIKRKSA